MLWPQAVNSGILKLSVLTPVLTVYRGASLAFSQKMIRLFATQRSISEHFQAPAG